MEKYKALEKNHIGGNQKYYKFENGFGASVLCGPYSYGGDRGLSEIGVLDNQGHLTYETDITGDVIGYLDSEQVNQVLTAIKGLDGDGKLPENYKKEWEKE